MHITYTTYRYYTHNHYTCVYVSVHLYMILGIQPKAFCMLSMCSTTELCLHS